eukprot:jgi/Galph1/3786/GphlegSOOS_G2505.1
MIAVEQNTVSIDENNRLEKEQWNRLKQRQLSRAIIVSNVPITTEDKYEKLCAVLRKVFQQVGSISKDGLLVPQNEEKKTKGFALVVYDSPQQALKAVLQLNDYPLDKTHSLQVKTLQEVERIMSTLETFEAPSLPSEVPKDVSSCPLLLSWLLDARGRDQFMIRHEEAEIYWFDSVGIPPQLEYSRMNWTESHCQWSPKGTYFATFHVQGIALWGGPKWERLMRFPHSEVKKVDFSAEEKYLVTWNELDPENDNPKDPECIIIWEVATGRKLRGFMGPKKEEKISWPMFQFSRSDELVARLVENAISFYTLPDMTLLDKRSMRIPDVVDFCWSPVDSIVAYWQPELENNPAKVTLVEMPSRREIRQKAVYSVANIELYWQQNGDFLCCKADRLTKSKKSRIANFEFFRMRQREIPIEVLEFKETVFDFAWEPFGPRFAIVHGDHASRANVSFYTVQDSTNQVRHILTLSQRPVNKVFWAPQNGFIVLAGLGSLNGQLEFYNLNEQESMNQTEHFMCEDVEWDSTGRFVATWVTCVRNKMECGYILWSFYGKEIHQATIPMFSQFQWRPRPKWLLSIEEQKKIKKNFKAYREKYEQEDEELKEMRRSGKAAERRKLRNAWKEYLQSIGEDGKDNDIDRKKTEEENVEYIEEVVEELIQVKEEIIEQ